MRYLLSRLQIEGFRGINNEGDPLVLKLRPDSVNSVFAPNGAGKSSIFDALCYALKGSIPKLENLPAVEQSGDYYCNRFHSSGVGRTEISLQPASAGAAVEILVERHPDGTRHVTSPSGYPNPERLLAQLAGEATFLDQRTFLRFVDDSPLGRGRSFAALVGLEKISMMRQALEVLANSRTVKSDFELERLRSDKNLLEQTSSRALTRIQESHTNLLGQAPAGGADAGVLGHAACSRLKQQHVVGGLVSCDDIADVDFAALRTAIRDAEQGEKRNRLSLVIQAIAALEGLAPVGPADGERAALQQLILERDSALECTRGPQFHQLHQLLDELLATPEWIEQTTCPACLEEPEVDIRSTVAGVLEQYRFAAGKTEAIRQSWHASATRFRLAALEEATPMELPRAGRRGTTIDQWFSLGLLRAADVDDAFDYLSQLEVIRSEHIATLEREKLEIEAGLPPSLVDLTRAVEYAAQMAQALTEYRLAQRDLAALRDTLRRREEWQAFIAQAKEEFAHAEVALSTARVQELEASFKPMYTRIMGHSDVVPRLQKAQGTEELHLRLESFFGEQDLSASTLLSESYRNALAMSIFLSAALQATSDAHFLVLDDVTSSFDAGHQFNLMEVLRTTVARPLNASGPQVIILSHDGLLQKYFDAIAEEGGWFHQRLKGTAPRGMVFAEGVDADRVRAAAVTFLDSSDLGAGAQLVRQYLEHRLVQTIQKLRIPVPIDFAIRDDRKMVSNCLAAIQHEIELHEAANRLVLSSAQVTNLRSVHIPAIVGNWVSHYETGALESFSPSMLRGALDTIDLVADCFTYECTCQGASRRRHYKNLATKACQCSLELPPPNVA